MRVVCLQLNSQDDVDSNLETVACLLEEAAGQNVKLAVLPEMFAFMVVAQAQNDSLDGELIMADLSRERLDSIRQQLPALQHRRADLFLPDHQSCLSPQ
ncbi:nitrilase-related carbon-nitrogen hydrolase [Pelovirga terrestris]|uniref:CN hydrolase domain-containing protein n=1 Tax=Pelovirga terrestris TaxID=2771352 RepID=A0A8J6QM37_9BACT|nr:nitrilase-related carbon-nitrogen hydrolase [Pelovirga terrestris]MBD1401074.1 hypothetical protein [Pelovirga terrestris]